MEAETDLTFDSVELPVETCDLSIRDTEPLCCEENKQLSQSSQPEQREDCSERSCREGWRGRRKMRKTNSFKMVRFQEPSEEESVSERDSTTETLFPLHVVDEWTTSGFEELFMSEEWHDITEDRLLRKKILEPGCPPCPNWGEEVTVSMQAVLEDRTVVEKDNKLVFVIGEGDVSQALEEGVLSMQKGEITLLLADSQYTYGHLGRQPDIPAWAPLLYQLQLSDVRQKADPQTLPIAERIRIGNHKRERGNFYFQREEYNRAARAYCMGLEVLTTRCTDAAEAEQDEIKDYRLKCLNNLAMAQLKLEQNEEALKTCDEALQLDPHNVKALFRSGKVLLSDKGQYKEAMELLKRALKLEPSTKAIHAELSKLVKRQSGGQDPKPVKAPYTLGEGKTPFLFSKKTQSSGLSWKLLLGALIVALASLVISVILTACN
ncbi:FKBP prolyl isomerase 16 isoform X2 [Periophthalmus magnuspinnatus]|uniref:FKBP prolyl isomerase 16 isoform X2 n=1 Tax=Periophthalmus magnuspinnatus TaxID=409849 RepID=UPI00243735A9|nr:FKBP prolyl isomerase 16 isoform X2 [Periophthalmus magnuspinnatus]